MIWLKERKMIRFKGKETNLPNDECLLRLGAEN